MKTLAQKQMNPLIVKEIDYNTAVRVRLNKKVN